MYDLIIIGGGPAGITAGIYAARKKIKTLILSKDFIGQTGKAGVVENWPGIKIITGPELMSQFISHLDEFEIDKKEGYLISSLEKKDNAFHLTTDKGEAFEAKSIIVATGRNPRPLRVPGEKEYLGKGISYCAICDAPMFAKKTVAVVGGGNSGFETAIEMATKHSAKVYLLEVASKPIADESLQEEVSKNDNIELITGALLKEVKGNNFVESIIYINKETKEEKELEVQGLFVEIGSVPAVDFLKDLATYNDAGEVEIDHNTCETKTPGLFAAGDATNIKGKQVIIAAGEGSKAALSVYSYLRKL